MGYMIEITEHKFEELCEDVEKMMRLGGKVMRTVEEMKHHSGGMGERSPYYSGGMGERSPYYSEGMGERGGYHNGGGMGERNWNEGGDGFGERQGVRGTGPYSRFRR